jgi:hypothetical protein
MRNLIYQIPKSKYQEYIQDLGSQKALVDIISLRIEQLLRQERTHLKHRETQEMVNLHIPISDALYPIVNEYCIQRGLSKKELINKILHTSKI